MEKIGNALVSSASTKCTLPQRGKSANWRTKPHCLYFSICLVINPKINDKGEIQCLYVFWTPSIWEDAWALYLIKILPPSHYLQWELAWTAWLQELLFNKNIKYQNTHNAALRYGKIRVIKLRLFTDIWTRCLCSGFFLCTILCNPRDRLG